MYLLDEYDLKVFHTDDEKSFFKEVVSTYYASNYRSSIVMLYSLVVLNLYNKLQIMANEDSSAGWAMPRTRSSVSIGRPWNVSASGVDDMVHGRSLRFEARTVQCGS